LTDGTYINSLEDKSNEGGKFLRPWGLTIDRHGNVFIADWNNHRIQKFDSEGFLIKTIDGNNNNPSFMYPSDVAVDSDDDIYISDWWNNKVLVYDKDGHYLTTFIGDAEELSAWGQQQMDTSPDHQRGRLLVKNPTQEWRFNRPTSIVIDRDNRILVSESQRMRIQIYQKESNWKEPQFNL
jgi:sugar lactone lactonase YvrE